MWTIIDINEQLQRCSRNLADKSEKWNTGLSSLSRTMVLLLFHHFSILLPWLFVSFSFQIHDRAAKLLSENGSTWDTSFKWVDIAMAQLWNQDVLWDTLRSMYVWKRVKNSTLSTVIFTWGTFAPQATSLTGLLYTLTLTAGNYRFTAHNFV